MTVRADCDRYVAEVLRFARVMNLTAVRDAGEFRRRFVEPSLALAELIPERGRLLDVGSGMGVPGVPILLARRGLHGILVERRAKRAEFLRHVSRLLGLDTEVFAADLAALSPLAADVCVARAVTRPGGLLKLCAPHAVDGTMAVLPVPADAEPAEVSGWRLRETRWLHAGVRQKVQIYAYGEGVSRET